MLYSPHHLSSWRYTAHPRRYEQRLCHGHIARAGKFGFAHEQTYCAAFRAQHGGYLNTSAHWSFARQVCNEWIASDLLAASISFGEVCPHAASLQLLLSNQTRDV